MGPKGQLVQQLAKPIIWSVYMRKTKKNIGEGAEVAEREQRGLAK